ncbi:hypothetical protein [Flammeovirga sp. SJP92]|uniref:hypothetical protein n=1 Tax=Flammeovirga sp. SJP92 TaxID=1775430 RepID=UPI000788DE2F|nr:hypothetical protein [Flammeovirga sp. SJP92]KXX70611.1 hypothetical protein AVL50_07255 [Flammeovirga sp. SJP92]
MNKQQQDIAWNKLKPLGKKDPFLWRQDQCGAAIYRYSYGKTTAFGWEVDHIYPKGLQGNITKKAVNGINNSYNLIAMHWKNNKSKSINYPSFNSAVTYDSKKRANVNSNKNFTVNILVQVILRLIFGI